jgi:hypothetical protein
LATESGLNRKETALQGILNMKNNDNFPRWWLVVALWAVVLLFAWAKTSDPDYPNVQGEQQIP